MDDVPWSEEIEVTLKITWSRACEVKLSGKQLRKSRKLPSTPGVYRIRINANGQQVNAYIGQGVNVGDRVGASLRSHRAEIEKVLNDKEANGNVQVDLATNMHAVITEESGVAQGPLHPDAGEHARLMAEGVAVGVESANDGLLNRAYRRK